MRSSSLNTAEDCQRLVGANFLISNGIAHDYGFEFNKTIDHVGSAVGTAAHEGVAFLMNEYKKTGEWGGARRSSHAASVAGAVMSERTRDKLLMDKVTQNNREAVIASQKIVIAYHQTTKPDGEPIIVEKGLKCTFTDPITGFEYEITGTLDSFIMGGVLRDLKTATEMKNYYAQLGCYIDLLESNGYEVNRAVIDHFPRTRPGRMQQPGTVVGIDMLVAKKHSRLVHLQTFRALQDMLDSGDPEVLMAKPSTRLCSKKFCPAWSTDFCKLGALVNE